MYPIWNKHLNVSARLVAASAEHILMPSFIATNFYKAQNVSETYLRLQCCEQLKNLSVSLHRNELDFFLSFCLSTLSLSLLSSFQQGYKAGLIQGMIQVALTICLYRLCKKTYSMEIEWNLILSVKNVLLELLTAFCGSQEMVLAEIFWVPYTDSKMQC